MDGDSRSLVERLVKPHIERARWCSSNRGISVKVRVGSSLEKEIRKHKEQNWEKWQDVDRRSSLKWLTKSRAQIMGGDQCQNVELFLGR